MNAVLVRDRAVLFCGDSSEADLSENIVDAIVTDPPAGIGFMGKAWDKDRGGRDAWIQWLADTLSPAYRALKPGGHALVWAIPRTSHWTAMALELAGFEIRDVVMHVFKTGFPKSLTPNSAPIPKGTGTALKPACEHWILARKPPAGTIAETAAKHGTGVLQIDACRDGSEPPKPVHSGRKGGDQLYGVSGKYTSNVSELGRWPAHLVADEGISPLAYFVVAKPSRKEKDAGLEHLPTVGGGEATGRKEGSAGTKNPRAGAGRTGGAKNYHPTIKAQALMRWLIRLITPPGGVVLDPFCGSGSTGVAAIAEGHEFIGIEQSENYCEIAKARLEHALKDSPEENDHGVPELPEDSAAV